MRLHLLLASALALGAAQGTPPQDTEAPLRESLLWNARERTATAIQSLGSEDPSAALPAFDTAQRLRPDEPRTSFNAGSARIGVDPKAAAALLEPVAKTAPEALASDAWYNLGNANLAGENPQGALDAFVEALRRDPSRLDAKFNLELAQRALEKQQQEQEKQQGKGEGGDAQDQQESKGEKSDEPGEPAAGSKKSESEKQSDSDSSDQDQKTEANPAPGQAGANQRESPLPQFRDLPDMTAEQAAAILQAVENLERRQRRERALEAAARRGQVEIDW